ncbi:hypothetical protein T440DRAFT_502337 [Plenodomus tracheiphilus IPT5]|uniref:Aminoglycoside phosphotransferase domain-containing protein n=1 Tax=Plenodomus tracheiphilus IPT5 TaxID=1408161 RepID=A0A6A7AU01_9PLEO|nr:hypothetical protein T440DRAFT_502337 [Plenodomus tracheiphilus IPT5]
MDLEYMKLRIVETTSPRRSSSAVNLYLPEGNFNKTLLITTRDRRQVIARLPNPNAGFPHYTTASEVATMDYFRRHLKIPIPKVLSYNTDAVANAVGAEYIIMEKCPGIELTRFWDQMTGTDKVNVGSLYYAKDIPDIKDTEVDETFSVGPTTIRTWFDDKRGIIAVPRGPWRSAEDVLVAIVNRELACLDTFSRSLRDRQQGIFNGPGGFEPTKKMKEAVIRNYSSILPFILPEDEAYTASVLWHNDLHSENILVNEDCPTEITGIIDWQCVHLGPALLHVHYPSLVDYGGPMLGCFELPELPDNFSELDPISQAKAQELHTSQTIWGLYNIFIQKQALDLLRVLRYRDTLQCQIMGLIEAIFDDGEPYVQSMISQLVESGIWDQVVKAAGRNPDDTPCPLAYTSEEISNQQNELARWEKDIRRKARVIKEVGAYTGWDGAVSLNEHGIMSEQLKDAKTKFLGEEAKTSEERAEWVKVWPFQDS